ncbi:unnamed protein product [Mytilus edulis]|uniref:Uncharacterized protein n=1 Tax=Mytilus edulis TaxID=6550 RepID=A0A8S3UYV4_MYTED|nr:unnamed protein product [Mytilus edulis]
MSLIGASLAKSIKWNFYNYELHYGTTWYMYAYQTLWTSYDAWTGNSDKTHMQVLNQLKTSIEQKLFYRFLEAAAKTSYYFDLVLGALSFGVLLTGSLVSCSRKKSFVLNCFRIASSVLSISAGSLLVYTLKHFQNNYQSILTDIFDSVNSGYPKKDNLSTGFYIAAFATTFFFISAVANIANVIILLKAGTTPVQPIKEGSKEI